MPEIGRVAEAHHAAVAEDQVETDGGDREDHHAPEEIEVERLIGEGRDRGHERQEQAARGEDDRAAREIHQERLRAGNNPSGRKNNTAAIKR